MRFVASLTLFAAIVGTGGLRADDKKVDPKYEERKKRFDELDKQNEELNKLLAELDVRRKLMAAFTEERSNEMQTLDARRLWREHKEDMKGEGQRGLPRAPVPRIVYKQPVLPADLRGRVTEHLEDFLIIDIGQDAGLMAGTILDLYRTEGEKVPRLLGKVKVTSAFNLYPKQAVVKFTPARDVAFDKLTPDERPKKGDTVRPPAPQPE